MGLEETCNDTAYILGRFIFSFGVNPKGGESGNKCYN